MNTQVSVSVFCWDSWEAKYPAEVVDNEPDLHYGKFVSRKRAQDYISNLGIDEMPTTADVVRYGEYYYVVNGVGF